MNCFPTTLALGFVCWLSCGAALAAAPPQFPRFGTEKVIRGELVEADFIHRTGKFRTSGDEIRRFSLLPHAIMTYRGVESDLRDIPLGAEFEFQLLPDEGGELTRLVSAKPVSQSAKIIDEEQRQRFIDFTKARGLAGWIDETSGKKVMVTFFSGDPEHFDATWSESFAMGSPVTVCVANDELRTWQPTSCGEKGTIVETRAVPITGHGCSGRQVVVQVNNMLEGFRQGRIVRIFGAGWKVRNQVFQECLINYGYSQQPAPDFRENLARHYPEQFPYRTDFGNRDLPWFQAKEGSQPPMYAEHVMYGELTAIDAASESGEFREEGTGKRIEITMLDTGARFPPVRFQSVNHESPNSRLSSLEIGLRYRFHMFQDEQRRFTRCGLISDDYSQAALNSLKFQVLHFDQDRLRLEVAWQAAPVRNYNGDMETPPPYGHSVLNVTPRTRVFKDNYPAAISDLKPGALLRFNRTADFPGKPGHCSDLWIIENELLGKTKFKK